jgi:hypothetical protein
MLNNASPIPLRQPDWPAPAGVHACMSTRLGGHSTPPFDSLNLGDHVGDDAVCVQHNRKTFAQALSTPTNLPVRPIYLRQVHGHNAIELTANSNDDSVADACFTLSPHIGCTTMVADCLPVLIAHRSGTLVAAAHAGWRGLAGAGDMNGVGVLENFFKQIRHLSHINKASPATYFDNHEYLVWLGPCIGPDAFEVGEDVKTAFLQHTAVNRADTAQCFRPSPHQAHKYHADLAQLARLRLRALGVNAIYGNDSSAAWCTVRQASIWFSHRRDSGQLGGSGRMVACIWRT